MDYELILFELKPLLTAASPHQIDVSDEHMQSYLSGLDQLAIHLRSESNRTLIQQTGLLSQLIRLLDSFFGHAFETSRVHKQFMLLSSELTRCVANSFVDNDKNRTLFWNGDSDASNKIIDLYVGRVFDMKSNEEWVSDLQFRVVVFLTNLVTSSEEYQKRIVGPVAGPLLTMILTYIPHFLEGEDDLLLATSLSLLSILVDAGFLPTLKQLTDLSEFLHSACKLVESMDVTNDIAPTDEEKEENTSKKEEEDTNSLTVFVCAVSYIIMRTTAAESYDFSAETLTSQLQRTLLLSQQELNNKQFENALITNRQILTAIGNVSANLSYSNKQDCSYAIDTITSKQCSYAVASSLLILTNYIGDKNKAEEVNSTLTYDDLIDSCSTFKDPMQYQGFLDLLKKLLNPSALMLTSVATLQKLSNILVICHDQAKYYEGLRTLIEKLLEKLLAIASATTILTLVEGSSRFSDLLSENGVVVACLAIDKLAKKRDSLKPSSIENILEKVLHIVGESSSTTELSNNPLVIFRILRSTSIYLTETPTEQQTQLFDSHSSELTKLLEVCEVAKGIRGQDAEAIWNNGQFFANKIISSECSSIPKELRTKAQEILSLPPT